MKKLSTTKNNLEKLLIDKKNNNLSSFELFNLVQTIDQKHENKIEDIYNNQTILQNENIVLKNEIIELKYFCQNSAGIKKSK